MASTAISDAAHKCLASFDAIAQVKAGLPERLHSEDCHSRYQIWASNLGSLHPGIDRRSADYRLRETPEVVERIVELLDELTEINSDIFEIVSGGRANRQISESKDDLESSDELSELNLSAGDIITSLFKVSMLVKNATARDRYAKAASAKEAAFLAEFDIRHVADKYPKLRMQPWLLERLGNAITQRRQFLRYCRNHKHRIAHVAPRETLPHELLPRPARIDGNLEIPVHAASTTNTPLTRPTLTPTTASTLHADRIAVEDLQDLDRDDAVSQATSVAYSQVDPDDTGVLHVPRLEEVSHVQPFECPFCFGIVQAKRQHSWRKHVLSDLRAYVCMSADCDAGLFEDKATWQEHDAEYHQRSWSCGQCRSGPFTSAKSFQDHLRSTHEVGELPDDVIAKLVDASSHSVSEAAPDCPFCDFENDVRNNATAKGQDLLPSAPVVIPLADYHRHLAFHQEQLALFAIPPEVERNIESGSNHDRSNADPQDNVQFMTKWRDLVDITDIDNSPEDVQHGTAPDLGVQAPAEPGPGDNIPLTSFDDLKVVQDAAIGDHLVNMPTDGEPPIILPGQIVYIPQEINKQLSYKKGVYLGWNKDNKHIARDWNSGSEIEVSLSTLVQKTDRTTEEKEEAASFRAYQPTEDVEAQARSYRKRHTLDDRACKTLLLEAYRLGRDKERISRYEESDVKPLFLNFAQRFSERGFVGGVMLEDIVRMFYATATFEQIKDATSSEAMWKADIERSTALLMNVLIKIVELQHDIDKDAVAQLRAEQSQMVTRANEAVKLASDSYFRQSFTDRQSTFDHAEGNQLEIDFPTLQALKLRVHDVASGQEQLPGFEDGGVKRTFKTFLQFMEALPVAGTSLVEDLVRDFRRCAIHQLNDTLDRDQRNAIVRRQEALLLSLLISVDARVQSELHGTAPRIRSRFTTILMEERARLSFSASRSEALSTQPTGLAHHTDTHSALPEEPGASQGDVLRENEETMERPPRLLRCYSCEHTWTSSLAADLRDCPNCGSYSVFAESPRRTASPDNTGILHRTSALGEDALGQYFSERTDKYMNLYRQEQPVPKSTTDSHESLPNPWEHLHSSSNASLAKTSRTPQGGEVAQTEQSTTGPASKDRPNLTAAQWQGMQQVLEHICDYRDEDGYNPSNYFNRMVNKRIIPDYYDVIKEPMALSSIKEKIETRAYQSIREFVRDFALIPFNAQVFHRPDSGAFQDALIVQRELIKQLRRLVGSGVVREEDSILPDLGEIPNHDYSPDHSYRLDGSGSESPLATDPSMKSLREWQENARQPLQSSSNTSEQKVSRALAEKPITQGKPQEPLGASAISAAFYDHVLTKHILNKKPKSEFDTGDITPESERESERQEAVKLGSPLMICRTCRYRFDHLAIMPDDCCPKCSSESVYVDFPWETQPYIMVGDTTDRRGAGSSLHPLGIAPTQLFDLIHDIDDATAKLQDLQRRHSQYTRDLPEALDQLLTLNYGFRRLANFQKRPGYHLRFQRIQEDVHVLCSSVYYTIATALNALRNPLDETQWKTLSSSMRDIEHTDILERLPWYQDGILGLLAHLDGFAGDLGIDTNIRSLLERQASIRKPKPSSNPGTPPENLKTEEETDSINLTDPNHIQSTRESLKQLTASTARALETLQSLDIRHSGDATIVPEITEDLQSLSNSSQKLSRLHDGFQYDPNFVQVQEPIQVLCRSMQCTVDAMLGGLTTEPEEGKTMVMRWTRLEKMMAEEERVSLTERLKWYSTSVLGFSNHLDGFPSPVRTFQWHGMGKKIRSLLERQEKGGRA